MVSCTGLGTVHVFSRLRAVSRKSGRSLGQRNSSSAFWLSSVTNLQCDLGPVPFCFQASADPPKMMKMILKLPSNFRIQRTYSLTDVQMSVCYFMQKLLDTFK